MIISPCLKTLYSFVQAAAVDERLGVIRQLIKRPRMQKLIKKESPTVFIINRLVTSNDQDGVTPYISL